MKLFCVVYSLLLRAIPIMAKITMPANNEVEQLVTATKMASLVQSLLAGLYEEYAINPPKAKPREKNI